MKASELTNPSKSYRWKIQTVLPGLTPCTGALFGGTKYTKKPLEALERLEKDILRPGAMYAFVDKDYVVAEASWFIVPIDEPEFNEYGEVAP